MGVTIHYRGQLDDVGLLESLRDELADIAETLGWPSATLDDDWSEPPNASLGSGGVISGHLGLRGITITPHPKSESLDLFFDREGTIRSPMTVLMLLDGSLEPGKTGESIKTQFSDADTHIWVIGLLKYLKKKFAAMATEWLRAKRQPAGEEFDLDALVNHQLQWRAGQCPDENVYIHRNRELHDVSALILLDRSYSTDGYIDGERVLDIIRETIFCAGEVLSAATPKAKRATASEPTPRPNPSDS